MNYSTRKAINFITKEIKFWRSLYAEHGLQPLQDMVVLTSDPDSDREADEQALVDWGLVDAALNEELAGRGVFGIKES